MHNRLTDFLEKNIIYYLQFSFRKKLFYKTCFNSFDQLISESPDNGKFVCGIFVDLQKEFDTVDHDTVVT